jgi:Holliday junction resolvase RusA-like endonuclease
LNDYITTQRTRYHARANREKQRWTDLCAGYASGLGTVETPIRVRINWYEKNARRDVDNVAFSVKFILDGLVRAGVIPNDSQRYVRSIEHHVLIDRENPRIEVELTTCQRQPL